jgi:hypothetical protein
LQNVRYWSTVVVDRGDQCFFFLFYFFDILRKTHIHFRSFQLNLKALFCRIGNVMQTCNYSLLCTSIVTGAANHCAPPHWCVNIHKIYEICLQYWRCILSFHRLLVQFAIQLIFWSGEHSAHSHCSCYSSFPVVQPFWSIQPSKSFRLSSCPSHFAFQSFRSFQANPIQHKHYLCCQQFAACCLFVRTSPTYYGIRKTEKWFIHVRLPLQPTTPLVTEPDSNDVRTRSTFIQLLA